MSVSVPAAANFFLVLAAFIATMHCRVSDASLDSTVCVARLNVPSVYHGAVDPFQSCGLLRSGTPKEYAMAVESGVRPTRKLVFSQPEGLADRVCWPQ